MSHKSRAAVVILVAMAGAGCGAGDPVEITAGSTGEQTSRRSVGPTDRTEADALAVELDAQETACSRISASYDSQAAPTTLLETDSSMWMPVVLGADCGTGWILRSDMQAAPGTSTQVFAAPSPDAAAVGRFFPGLGPVSATTVKSLGVGVLEARALSSGG